MKGSANKKIVTDSGAAVTEALLKLCQGYSFGAFQKNNINALRFFIACLFVFQCYSSLLRRCFVVPPRNDAKTN